MQDAVFISYAREDGRVAAAICAGLERAGLRCWIAPRDISPGQEWGAAIIEAIERASAMVLVFSSASNRSKHVHREVERAVAKDIPIVQYRVENVAASKQLEYFLSTQHWLDASNAPLEQVDDVVVAVTNVLGRDVPAPTPAVDDDHDEPVGPADTADLQSAWARTQARILNADAHRDYVWLSLMGALPIVIAWSVGALYDVPVDVTSEVYSSCVAAAGPEPKSVGYLSRWNWWPYFMVLPFAVWMMRRMAVELFPLSGANTTLGVLKKIPTPGQPRVAEMLAAAALDGRNLRVALAILITINVIDLREIVTLYTASIAGTLQECPREFDWTVHFLATADVSLVENAILIAAAYPCQFVIHGVGLMLFGLLLRHNYFYLQRIYQRNNSRRGHVSEHIVLDFNDVERCFGLRELHGIFNFQIILIITGGVVIMASRFSNADVTPLGLQYEAAIARLLGTSPQVMPEFEFSLTELFPDAGQIMLGIAWVTCFAIVALPSVVKFLPLIHKHVRLVGRREYLLEFIPPSAGVRLATTEEVDSVARKFARSSFWPAGDERARTLYTIAFLVFFVVIIPIPPTSRQAQLFHLAVLFVLSYVFMKLLFRVFRKALVTIDATLAQD